jgi:hypothetical protein
VANGRKVPCTRAWNRFQISIKIVKKIFSISKSLMVGNDFQNLYWNWKKLKSIFYIKIKIILIIKTFLNQINLKFNSQQVYWYCQFVGIAVFGLITRIHNNK